MIDAIEINAMNLYSLSNYEKGRLCTSKLLSAQEKKRLKASVEIMSMILCVLERKNCQIEKINVFIDNNRGKIFPIDCDFCETILSTTPTDVGSSSRVLFLLSYRFRSRALALGAFFVHCFRIFRVCLW